MLFRPNTRATQLHRYQKMNTSEVARLPGARVFQALRAALAGCVLTVAGSLASAQSFDYVIPLTQETVDNAVLQLPAGSVIGIQAGERGRLVLTNFHGAPGQRFVFKNKDGKVRVKNTVSGQDAIGIGNCSEFEFRGDGVAGIKYGIEIYESYGPSSLGIGALSTNYEVCFIEAHHNFTFSGITAKTDPGANGYAQRGNFTQYDTKIHDCYMHDLWGEGFYIGSSFYTQGHGAEKWLPHDIIGLRVYNNITERTGREGIQVGSAPQDVEIYNNICIDSGIAGLLYQENGVQLGGGTTGKFYNNIIIGAQDNGLTMGTRGDVDIFNNIIVDAASYGIFSNDDTTPGAPGGHIRFYNNTIINPGLSGLLSHAATYTNEFRNNIGVIPNTAYNIVDTDVDTTVIQSNNLSQTTTAGIGFINESLHDYRIPTSSPAANAGANLSAAGLTTDLEGKPRPFGVAYDQGAYEAGALSVQLYTTQITAYGANNGMIAAAALGGTSPYTYAWSDGPTTSGRTGLAPGTYTVTVTDAASTSRTRSFAIVQPDPLNGTIRAWPELSGANNGRILLKPHGGVWPYTIVWTDDPTLADPLNRYNLNAGVYRYTITDANGTVFKGIAYVRDAGTPIYRVNAGQIAVTDTFLNWGGDQRSTSAPPASAYFVQAPLAQQNAGGSQGAVGLNSTEANSAIFGSRRIGLGVDLQYAFPVANGTYEVQLFFREHDAAVTTGQRVFDIVLEGVNRLDNFDPYATAGYSIAIQRNFIVTVTDGTLNVHFRREVGNPMVSGLAVHSDVVSETVLTPLGAGTAIGSYSCPATGAFDEQPSWDPVGQTPIGIAAAPHVSTGVSYINRHWYIDLGDDYARYRIVGMWTRYRPFSTGNHAGFGTMWWDDDKDNVNDGINAPGLKLNSAQAVPHVGNQLWIRDVDFSSSPIVPQGRYLVIPTPANPTDRSNEFALIGYIVN